MQEGWIKLYRKLQDNPLWTCEPFTRGQAWVDLMLLANHKRGFFYKRGIKVEVNRGQVGVSEVGLANRWQWSRSKVRKFLKDLEKEQQIKQHKNNVSLLITVLNYEEYQQKEQQKRQQKDSKKTAKEQQKDTNKNEENEENDKNSMGETQKRFKKPTIDEIKEYCRERGNGVDPVKFFNHYEAKGWYIGKNKMKNWKAAVITWEQKKKHTPERNYDGL